ncbi:MAG: dihydrodipicolinate synthase family protein [Gammaproteobacteria bacterium]|nr:dihydrodipicolinate synthase family protein [Gammaproteobacteria bacterium]
MIDAGVHGLAVGGSTGEGHTLSSDELRQLVAIAVEEADGSVPIIAGIIADSTQQVIERAKVVADLEDSVYRDKDNMAQYSSMIATMIRKHELKPFTRDGMARLVEESSRWVEDREKNFHTSW